MFIILKFCFQVDIMRVKEIEAKSIITKSGLPDSEFVINPYVGYMHACIYCSTQSASACLKKKAF